jgi:hypothetical protein
MCLRGMLNEVLMTARTSSIGALQESASNHLKLRESPCGERGGKGGTTLGVRNIIALDLSDRCT